VPVELRFGTTMLGLSSGLPMVVVPLFALDQYVMARRIQAIGAGVALEDGPAAPARLRSALERLLGEEAYGIAARRIALEIEQLPPPPAAVALLEGLAKRST
jgi:UDP:flavonoid glycosyltransferase YjiC (YdhE family)